MEKNYINYTADDFIADEFFQQWALKPNEESNRFWIEWLKKNSIKQTEVKLALSFIHHVQIKTIAPSARQVEESLEKNLSAIRLLETPKKRTAKTVSIRTRLYWLAASVIILLAGAATFFMIQEHPVTIALSTGDNEIRTVELPDGSVVILNGNSSIAYSNDLLSSTKREIWLEGEAFFNVKHIETAGEAAHRFIVHSGDLNVEVLGTTFNIKNIASFTNVSLNTGKIKIDLNDQPGTAIYLQPGDFVQYSADQKRILKKLVKPELYSVWKEEKLTLDNVPLSEIAILIQDIYGYKVEMKNSHLAENKISGTLRLKDEKTFFETLEFALGITIVKKDSVLIFQQKAIPKIN